MPLRKLELIALLRPHHYIQLTLGIVRQHALLSRLQAQMRLLQQRSLHQARIAIQEIREHRLDMSRPINFDLALIGGRELMQLQRVIEDDDGGLEPFFHL